MNKYKEIEGDLIELAKKGEFDVIAHGCNCQCTMGAGIAPQMAVNFGADIMDDEYDSIMDASYREWHRSEKLGNIDAFNPKKDFKGDEENWERFKDLPDNLIVVNAYTQLGIGGRKIGVPDLDYEALTLCLRKMNHLFPGKHIGLPQIGCGLAGGDWERVRNIIADELKDCSVTVVIYKPKRKNEPTTSN